MTNQSGDDVVTDDVPVVLELPFPRPAAAKLAMRRGAYRCAAKALRSIGYPGAALALDALAESLRTDTDHEVDDDGLTTVVCVGPPGWDPTF